MSVYYQEVSCRVQTLWCSVMVLWWIVGVYLLFTIYKTPIDDSSQYKIYWNITLYRACFWHNGAQWAMTSSCPRFLDHKQRRVTVGRTPLDEWSARRRDLYLTTHNTHNSQISMPPVGFEPTISTDEPAADLRLRPRGHWDRLTLYHNACIVQLTSWWWAFMGRNM